MARLLAIAALGATFLTAGSAWADDVTPNDRVHSKLRVRAEPNTSSDTIGFLLPGDRVPLVQTSGPWREVQLESQHGFVASSYTIVLPSETPSPRTATTIRLGSWNIKKLGHGDTKDYAGVARIIEANFDILAIEEVMQKGGGHPGYDQLMAQLGSAWTGQVTDVPRPATTDGNSEFYAVVWRKAAVRACAGWSGLRYFEDNDGSPSATGPNLFSREPAFGCFEYGPADARAGDFILGVYHATFQSGTATNAEVGQLGKVFAAMLAAQPAEKDEIIVGDFNRTPTQLAAALPGVTDRTTGTGSTLNTAGAITTNLYDHMIVRDPAATTELQGDAVVLDVRAEAGSPAQYFTTMSDHLPVMIKVEALSDDD